MPSPWRAVGDRDVPPRTRRRGTSIRAGADLTRTGGVAGTLGRTLCARRSAPGSDGDALLRWLNRGPGGTGGVLFFFAGAGPPDRWPRSTTTGVRPTRLAGAAAREERTSRTRVARHIVAGAALAVNPGAARGRAIRSPRSSTSSRRPPKPILDPAGSPMTVTASPCRDRRLLVARHRAWAGCAATLLYQVEVPATHSLATLQPLRATTRALLAAARSRLARLSTSWSGGAAAMARRAHRPRLRSSPRRRSLTLVGAAQPACAEPGRGRNASTARPRL